MMIDPSATATLVTAVALLGLLTGSFLNIVICRVPAGKSLLLGSACPHCDSRIKLWQSIPVFGWLALRGRCGSCTAPISLRYPLVEVGTALAFAGVAVWWLVIPAAWPVLAAYLFLMAVTVVLACIDLNTFKLPNVIVLPAICVMGALLAITAVLSGDYQSLIRALIGSAVLTGFYGLLWWVWPGGMGFGDVKLAALLGLALGWIGWGALAVGSFSAFMLGGIMSGLIMRAEKGGRKARFPFGPWMLLGAWGGIFTGEQLTGWPVVLGLLGNG